MTPPSPVALPFNPQAAAELQPELERTVRDLRQCLGQCEALLETFRDKYLRIFSGPELQAAPGHPAWPALRAAYYFSSANLAAGSLAHLHYAAELADTACAALNHVLAGRTTP